jgi:hypothetical protein
MASIDERLDRLTELHEALSQTVELLSAQIAQDAENIRTLAGIAKNALDSIKSLENIATAHQHPDGRPRQAD